MQTAADVFKQGDALCFGRYVVEEKIHDGRFTTLWWAHDKGRQQRVVLKVGSASVDVGGGRPLSTDGHVCCMLTG